MNVQELRDAAARLYSDDFDRYIGLMKEFGGEIRDPDGLVKFFVQTGSQYEGRLAHMFGLKTEAEKALDIAARAAEAESRQAAAAEDAARSARRAWIWAAVAAVAAILSLVRSC